MICSVGYELYVDLFSNPCTDFMADCVDVFLKENNLSGNANDALPIGLAFPFPVEKTSLNQAKLIAWTKGLKVKNGEGEDVVRLLQDAFDRKQVHVRCAALVNDVSHQVREKSLPNP